MKLIYLLTAIATGGMVCAESHHVPCKLEDEELFLAPHIRAGLALCCGPEFLHIEEQDGIHSIATLGKKMSAGDSGVIVAPSSYEILFTSRGEDPVQLAMKITKACSQLPLNPSSKDIEDLLHSFSTVHRATCTMSEGRLILVQDPAQLEPGQTIWRKIGSSVHLSTYHTDEEFLIAMIQAGLRCEEIHRPCFFGKIKYRQYETTKGDQANLGISYQDHHPFTVYHVRKN